MTSRESQVSSWSSISGISCVGFVSSSSISRPCQILYESIVRFSVGNLTYRTSFHRRRRRRRGHSTRQYARMVPNIVNEIRQSLFPFDVRRLLYSTLRVASNLRIFVQSGCKAYFGVLTVLRNEWEWWTNCQGQNNTRENGFLFAMADLHDTSS